MEYRDIIGQFPLLLKNYLEVLAIIITPSTKVAQAPPTHPTDFKMITEHFCA